MTINKKTSTFDALMKYSKKNDLMPKKKRRASTKPEKTTEKDCLIYMRSLGWSVDIFESKATYNPRAGRYISQSIRAGTCDCMGSMPDGRMVAIEFKALGHLSTFNRPTNHRQREFIINKINQNVFACVVDGSKRLEEIYTRWSSIDDHESKRQFLIKMLP